MVEISPRAESVLDARLTRRLVEIEVNDTEVPPRPGSGNGRPIVFFRVLSTSPEWLRVELWERGEYFGARKLGAADVKELLARRVALAAGALVRDMKARRAAQARTLEREAEIREAERAALAEALLWPAVMLEPRALGAAVGPSDFFLGGPGLGATLRTRSGSRLGVGMAWLFGAASAAEGSPALRWLELSITPEHAFRVGSGLDLAVGVTAAAAAVHVTDVRAVDDVEGELDTWSARTVARVMAEPRLARHLRLSVGPEIGLLLRRIPIVDQSGEEMRLGRVWLGASVGLTIDPAGRW